MAYLRTLAKTCVRCGVKATVQLIDRWNGERGCYCRKCCARALREQLASEGAP